MSDIEEFYRELVDAGIPEEEAEIAKIIIPPYIKDLTVADRENLDFLDELDKHLPKERFPKLYVEIVKRAVLTRLIPWPKVTDDPINDFNYVAAFFKVVELDETIDQMSIDMSDIFSSSVFSRRIYEGLVNVMAPEKLGEILRKLREPVINYIHTITSAPDKEYKELVRLLSDLELSEYQIEIIVRVIQEGIYQSIYDEQISDEKLLDNFCEIFNLEFREDQIEILYRSIFRYVKAVTGGNYKEYKELLRALLNLGLNKAEAGLTVGLIPSELLTFLYYKQKAFKSIKRDK